MIKSKSVTFSLLITFLWLTLSASLVSAGQIQGQKSMLVIDDTFQFIPGTWARYTVRDKKKQEDYDMILAVLEPEKRREGPCFWIEVTIKARNSPRVVTRFLMPKTRQGPGNPLEAIVQIKGYDPFTVPESFMKGKDAEVGQQQKYHLSRKIRKSSFKLKSGGMVEIWKVDAVNNSNKHVTAWVSKRLPPLGVYKIDTPETGMYLRQWGTRARSRITGTPMNFYLWLTSLVGNALNDDSKK